MGETGRNRKKGRMEVNNVHRSKRSQGRQDPVRQEGRKRGNVGPVFRWEWPEAVARQLWSRLSQMPIEQWQMYKYRGPQGLSGLVPSFCRSGEMVASRTGKLEPTGEVILDKGLGPTQLFPGLLCVACSPVFSNKDGDNGDCHLWQSSPLK